MHTETRDCVLRAHALEMLARTNLEKTDFADLLYKSCAQRMSPASLADRKVPDFESLLQTNDTAEYLKAAGRWQKRVDRWLDNDGTEIPAWVEESWVTALLPEWRERCLNELAARYGYIPVRPVILDGMGGMQTFSALMRRVGDVAGLGSHVFDDLVIDENDGVWLPDFIAALDSMGAKCATLSRLAKQALERTSQLNASAAD